MSINLRLFTIVVWLGVLANWAFGIWAIFFNTASLLDTFGLGAVPSTIWVYNYSVLLIILSCFYIPAAHDPFRYEANAWLLIVGRLVPASTFFIGVWLGFMPEGFVRLGIGDATFGILELILLIRLRREAAAMLPLWNWNARTNFGLHRDGLNTSLTEIVLNSGIGNGASNRSIDRVGLERLQKWIGALKPPAYPFAIDKALAARGETTWRQYCADCHAFGGAKVGQPIPIDEVGTDRHRFDSWTTQARDGFNGLDDYDWRYTHFRKTGGYMAPEHKALGPSGAADRQIAEAVFHPVGPPVGLLLADQSRIAARGQRRGLVLGPGRRGGLKQGGGKEQYLSADGRHCFPPACIVTRCGRAGECNL